MAGSISAEMTFKLRTGVHRAGLQAGVESGLARDHCCKFSACLHKKTSPWAALVPSFSCPHTHLHMLTGNIVQPVDKTVVSIQTCVWIPALPQLSCATWVDVFFSQNLICETGLCGCGVGGLIHYSWGTLCVSISCVLVWCGSFNLPNIPMK